MFSKKKVFGVMAATSLLVAMIAGPAHADSSELIITGGSLRVDTNVGAPDAFVGDFTGITLTGAPQLTSADITPFTVIDDRGTGVGWHINVTVGDFSDGDDYEIPADTVVMDAPTVTGAATADASTFTNAGYIDFTAARKIVSAPATTASMGTFLVSTLPLRLTVPIDTYAATYTSTTDVALVTAP